MIPKKLYIPTSTLNFNNIMSSESISPAAFYANRRFGYKRFEKVAPNAMNNLTLLYDKYPIFVINDKELENYPLVIEIDTQLLPEDSIQEKDGFYCTSKTIYLNPFSTRIIFRTDAEQISTLSKSEPSIESKLIPLYQGQFVVLPDEIETFDWQPINIDDLSDYDNIAVSFDIKINKQKGMLYGYLLGANETSSKEVVSLKKQVKDLRNVLSAILAIPDGHVTSFQRKQLEELYSSINQNFYTLNDVSSCIQDIIAEKIKEYNAPNFVEILHGEGFYEKWYREQVSKLNLNYRRIQPFSSFQTTNKIAELDEYIGNIEKSINVYDVKTKLDMSKMPIVQNSHIVDVPEQKELLPILFNEYMNEVWNGTEFLSSRYDFAKVGGKLFREKLGENWGNSLARAYINSLLKNLNEYTAFDINSTDSLILKSFAAFCQKGESDIDRLRDYLISTGINDFRIAFALWGLVFGFAEMPKTLTNDLFENKDEQYVSNCYKFIHKQLHNIELERNVALLDWKVTPLPEELRLIFDSEPFKKIKVEVQEYLKKETLRLYLENGFSISTKFVKKLKDLSYPNKRIWGKKYWEKCIAILENEKQSKRCAEMPQQGDLFDIKQEHHPIGEYFYNDNNVWFYIEPIIPKPNKEKVKNEIKWIQKIYREGGYVSGGTFMECKVIDNASVIGHFYNNSKNCIEGTLLTEICNKLKELYHVK